MPSASKTTPPNSKLPGAPGTPNTPGAPLDWRQLVWYVAGMLLILWLWQDFVTQATIIPYSEFKEHVRNREVVECQVQETEILGVILPLAAHPLQATAGQVVTKPAAGKPAAGKPTAGKPTAGKPNEGKPNEGKPTETKPTEAKPTMAQAAEAKAATEVKGTVPAKTSVASAKPTSTAEVFFRTVRVDDPKLIEDLEAADVKFSGVHPGFLTNLFMAWIIPIGVMFLLWTFLARRIGTAGQSVLGIGKSRAKLVGEEKTGVTFVDVAGCDEAKFELEEVVDFLKHPERYSILGAKIPKGVLLVGPPGTGKTLMARAVAGEAEVPFFSLSGSDFVEMFVGVGASRVRDLFLQAKQQAPCIVFIDELDAIGRERSVHVGAVNDEREQTLNQLLVEMDGFDANVGVILLAATNRPEVLDKALLRPGRFDRQVIIDAPDREGRLAILKVHSRNKPLEPDVDLQRIARATPGFSGADLANALNEAALLAARQKEKLISQHDLEEAVEKVVAGPERRSRRLNDHERRRVAYHEVGHALVGNFSMHADPVQKISIVPRGRAALGYTLQLPTEEQFMMTQAELVDRLRGLLGGRAAEEIVFHEISTGAENDLERATAMARQMVCMYGMSEQVGLMHCASHQPTYLPNDSGLHTDCSDATEQMIDSEVKRLLADAYEEAKRILTEHREQLEKVAQELLVTESLDSAQFKKLLEG